MIPHSEPVPEILPLFHSGLGHAAQGLREIIGPGTDSLCPLIHASSLPSLLLNRASICQLQIPNPLSSKGEELPVISHACPSQLITKASLMFGNQYMRVFSQLSFTGLYTGALIDMINEGCRCSGICPLLLIG